MKELGVYDFRLFKHHGDYIQFTIRYSLEDDFWAVGGMGWISGNATNYYLGDLNKNKKLATIRDISKGGIVLQDYSLRFQHPALDRLTITNIESHWGKLRTRGSGKA